MTRSSESGIAMIITLFMVLILSLLGSTLMYVARTETLSSLNYQTMSQVRYAAESGVHSAANHILVPATYVPPPGTAGADPLAAYDTTTSPVRFNGADVVLSSDPTVASNYPVGAVRDAFAAATQGTLNVDSGSVGYTAVARLMSMRTINDAFTGLPVTLQTWEITGTGSVGGVGAARLQVSATIERQDTPIYKYAAFATDNGCDALKFGGNAHTDSYDSTAALGGAGTPTISASGGNVGTNGNLDELGNSTIAGTLSTPRSGVGLCSANNVTALTGNLAGVTGGIVQLSQAITYPTPPAPSPLPPTTGINFSKNGGCPAGAGPYCSASANGATFTPPSASTVVTLGNVSATAQAVLHLSAGIYVVNSISLASQVEIVVDGPGPVIFQVAGVGVTTPIDMTGGSTTNTTFNPSALQFIYGGTGAVKLAGGSSSAALLYAPLATVTVTGNNDFYGAVVAGKVTDMGVAAIHYDRSLQNTATTAGNPMMDEFNWKSY
jgi:Tfp pilus assembly protein PilX